MNTVQLTEDITQKLLEAHGWNNSTDPTTDLETLRKLLLKPEALDENSPITKSEIRAIYALAAQAFINSNQQTGGGMIQEVTQVYINDKDDLIIKSTAGILRTEADLTSPINLTEDLLSDGQYLIEISGAGNGGNGGGGGSVGGTGSTVSLDSLVIPPKGIDANTIPDNFLQIRSSELMQDLIPLPNDLGGGAGGARADWWGPTNDHSLAGGAGGIWGGGVGGHGVAGHHGHAGASGEVYQFHLKKNGDLACFLGRGGKGGDGRDREGGGGGGGGQHPYIIFMKIG